MGSDFGGERDICAPEPLGKLGIHRDVQSGANPDVILPSGDLKIHREEGKFVNPDAILPSG